MGDDATQAGTFVDPDNRFKIIVPDPWEHVRVGPPKSAGFRRTHWGLGWLSISVGPLDAGEAPYDSAEREVAIRRLCEFEDNVRLTQRFKQFTNVAAGRWRLESGRDDGPAGSSVWQVPSDRGIISIVTGPPDRAVEWVIQYRVSDIGPGWAGATRLIIPGCTAPWARLPPPISPEDARAQ